MLNKYDKIFQWMAKILKWNSTQLLRILSSIGSFLLNYIKISRKIMHSFVSRIAETVKFNCRIYKIHMNLNFRKKYYKLYIVTTYRIFLGWYRTGAQSFMEIHVCVYISHLYNKSVPMSIFISIFTPKWL